MDRPQPLTGIGETQATCQTQQGGLRCCVSTSRNEQVVVTRHCKQSKGAREVGTSLVDGTSLIESRGLHGSTAGQATFAELVKGSPLLCLDRVLSFNRHQHSPWRPVSGCQRE